MYPSVNFPISIIEYWKTTYKDVGIYITDHGIFNAMDSLGKIIATGSAIVDSPGHRYYLINDNYYPELEAIRLVNLKYFL